MCAKEGVGLGSLGGSYIATPDGLLWTKGVFSVCVAFQRDFSVTCFGGGFLGCVYNGLKLMKGFG